MDNIEKNEDVATPAAQQEDNAEASDAMSYADEAQSNGAQEAAPDTQNEKESKAEDGSYYENLAREDILAIHRDFPEARGISSVAELDNPLRYAALRDMGLTAREAYLATQSRRDSYDNRKHLRGSVPSAAGAASDAMSQAELSAARELFSGLSDRELQRLYKTVNK